MNAQPELATVAAYIHATWPKHPMPDETLDVLAMELAQLPIPAVIDVLRAYAASDQAQYGPPTPARLAQMTRDALAPPVPSADEAYAELMGAVERIGWAEVLNHPGEDWQPDWSHPFLRDVVTQRGGWREVCQSTPARAGAGATGTTAAQVFRAQFRDEWNALVARRSTEGVRDAIGTARVDALVEGAAQKADDDG